MSFSGRFGDFVLESIFQARPPPTRNVSPITSGCSGYFQWQVNGSNREMTCRAKSRPAIRISISITPIRYHPSRSRPTETKDPRPSLDFRSMPGGGKQRSTAAILASEKCRQFADAVEACATVENRS